MNLYLVSGSNTHYSLVREINNILHYGGHATKKEEKHLFVDTLPDHPLSDDKQRGLRPDISVLNYNGFGNKLCIPSVKPIDLVFYQLCLNPTAFSIVSQ